ncbi:zinc finger protein, partial [Corchorus capsularis]
GVLVVLEARKLRAEKVRAAKVGAVLVVLQVGCADRYTTTTTTITASKLFPICPFSNSLVSKLCLTLL